MNDLPSAPGEALAMRSAGALAYVEAELDGLRQALTDLPDWAPSRMLLAEAAWLRERLGEIAAAWERKLVVAIAGPSGAGKSTLLNALAGRELSPTGLRRPTTREVVLYVGARSDADPLLDHLGEGAAQVHVAAEAASLEQLILVDTPDTNTLPENQRLLARVLERADLVLAVFPAQNPKMQDNLAFLEPFVRHLPEAAVIPVLNMVDRVPRSQLDEIVADFSAALERNWQRGPGRVYLISALEGVGAQSVRDEEPLHTLNELPLLAEALFSSLNRAGEVVDRRLAHAEHLLDLFRGHCAEVLEASAEQRALARAALATLRTDLSLCLGESLTDEAERGGTYALHATLYGQLAGRWWGPLGWLVAAWAFLLRVGGLFGRPGHPERGLPGPEQGLAWGEAATRLERVYAEEWPAVADALVQAGFQPAVREGSRWHAQVEALAGNLAARMAQVYREQLARLGRRLSAWPLQVLLNAPVLATVGWVAYDTVVGFYQRHYLPAEYFRHAGITALVVWLAGFALLQVLVTAALRRSLRRRVADAVAADLGRLQMADLASQVERLDLLRDSVVPADVRPRGRSRAHHQE